METRFLLNGAEVRADTNPTRTLLDWLREDRGLTGTKEGCNEGDCGACTVMVTDATGSRALNACILFLPQLQGKAVHTVEGLAAPDGTPHPVQAAMVAHHGSQCGFCTPGFVVSLATAHLNGATDHDDQLAGNLCRCTGYAPIIRAAQAAQTAPVPAHLQSPFILPKVPSGGEAPHRGQGGQTAPLDGFHPRDADDLAHWYAANPDATLIAGATDVGLWVTKGLRDLSPVAFIAGLPGLTGIDRQGDTLRVGAAVTIADLRAAIATSHASFAELLRRYGAQQVRNAATLGGNIANGSPIGDSPPALIAMGATLHLRQGATRRDLPLEDFFLAYRKQDRRPGEFVEAVTFPAHAPRAFRCYKLSKRFDDDISAVCGSFNVTVEGGQVTHARLAFGGMAGTPACARAAEAALKGRPWNEVSIATAMAALNDDFQPMSDARASAAYRMRTAQNMLMRYWHDVNGQSVDILQVAP